MKVDIQDRDARGAPIAQELGGDRGVVEEAIAAVQIACRVMPRGAAQGERRAAKA